MQTSGRDEPRGVALAVMAYLLWGVAPIYMKLMAHVPAVEFVAHRVLWSLPVAGIVLLLLRRTDDLVAALRDPKMLRMAFLTSGLISVNWAIFVWAISNGRAIDAALGYYINPLFIIALGALVLREQLTRNQMIAVGLAACGVLVLVIEAGEVPWVSLGLTVSWGVYALFKRSLPIGPNQGFLLEVLILCPVALVYVLWLGVTGQGTFGVTGLDTLLLIGLGPVTAAPLMIYANAAKLVRLSTIGILQYIAPSMILLTAVFLFGEEMGRGRMIAFPLIWAGLVVYTLPMLRQVRRA